MRAIPHNMPTLDHEEIQAVARVIASGHIISGREVKKFENDVKRIVGSKYAVAVSTGHAALHLALVVLGIQQGDEIILPSYTVSDILNTIFYTRATPVVVDIEPTGFGVDPKEVRRKITKKTKAIIVPHMFGIPADVHSVQKLGIPIIEDSAQALGSYYKDKPIGSFSDLNIFSFYASKILTTGQGGMITTNNKHYYDRLRDLLDYNGPKKYTVRYNYQLTDILASIGNVQLKKLPDFIKRRQEIAERYAAVLTKKNVVFYPHGNGVNYFRFVIEFPNAQVRQTIQEECTKRHITTIIPLNSYESIHEILELKDEDFPHTYKKTTTTLSLPLYPGLKDEQVHDIKRVLEEVL